MQSDVDTAHRHWDAVWETGAGQDAWSRADPWVVDTVSFLHDRNVLRAGGIYQGTMLSKRNAQYGIGIEVSPDTFQQPDAEDDKVHPHLYCDAHDLIRLHPGMQLPSAADRDQGAPGTSHWHCLFEVGER